jgi:hypothetical protein
MVKVVTRLVSQGLILCESLRKHAGSGEMFQLAEPIFRLAIHGIGLVSLYV